MVAKGPSITRIARCLIQSRVMLLTGARSFPSVGKTGFRNRGNNTFESFPSPFVLHRDTCEMCVSYCCHGQWSVSTGRRLVQMTQSMACGGMGVTGYSGTKSALGLPR